MITRRRVLKSLGLAACGTVALPAVASRTAGDKPPLSYCLNTSTIRGQNPGFLREFDVASQAGYSGIEIWIDPLNKFLANGGTLNDVALKAADLGLTIENAIGFAQWIVDDEQVRLKALEQLRREMGLLARTGCKRIAAPPMGAHQQPGLDLEKAAMRYREILEIGRKEGVIPQLEFWGAAASLHSLGQALHIAAAANDPDARILADIYHLHRGGSGFEGLGLVAPGVVEVFHINDYPGDIPREKLKDSDRVYPGDGVAPVKKVISHMLRKKAPVVMSLELFNENYWKMDALEAAKRGLVKMRQIVSECT